MAGSLGEKIKELRKERGWTQNELSKRSGVDRTTIASIETGKVLNPSPVTFIKLARAFNKRPEVLYQAAGYISDVSGAFQYKELPEQILDRFRISMPATVPIYPIFPHYLGQPAEPADYIAIVKNRARGKMLEAYVCRGQSLEPEIKDGDIIIVDRDAQIENGDIVAYLFEDVLHLARLKTIAGVAYLENNQGRLKLEEAQSPMLVIEKRTRYK